MSDDLWILVPNWKKFQHYGDRDPLWIKVYTELNSRDDFLELTQAGRGLLLTIWLEFARSRGRLKAKTVLALSNPHSRYTHLKPLSDAGFIELSASAPERLSASPHALAREEEEKEVTPPTPPPEGGTEKPSRAAGTNPRAVAKQAGDDEHVHLHANLLAEASRVAAGWNDGGSDEFDQALDELERSYHQQLGALERDTLWDVAFSR